MISLQAACRDDPEKRVGSQGFRPSVDLECQMAVFFAGAEPKDLLQMEEAADDDLPLFVVNRFDVGSVILRLFDFSVGSKGEAISGEPGGKTRRGDNRRETS